MPQEITQPGSANYSVQVIAEERTDGTIAFNALLQNCTEAVVTLRLELQNMLCDKKIPVTVNATAGKMRFNVANIWAPNPEGNNHYRYWTNSIFGRMRSTTTHRAIYALPYKGSKYIVAYVYPDHKALSNQPGDEHFVGWRMPVGTTVRAAREGVVIAVRADVQATEQSAGNYVVIRHPDGTYGRYIHLHQNGLLVRLGQKVSVHQPIGLSGASGGAPYPQLAFQVYQPISGYTRHAFPLRFRDAEGKVVAPIPGRQYYL